MHFRFIVQFLYRHFSEVRFSTILTLMLLHYLSTYLLYDYFGEEKLTSSHIHYVYFWVVTCATVGFGDATPVTDAGKLLTAFVMIPTSLSLFGVFLAKLSNTLMTQFRKELHGMRDFHHYTNHILIMGYHELRTHEFVQLIQSDPQQKLPILVVTNQDITHPFTDNKGVDFCKVVSMKDPASLARVGLQGASKIIVDGVDDNQNYVLAAQYAHMNPNAHISTYIADVYSADHLQRQFPSIEVVVDNREEMMVRALMDSGSSRMVSQLLRSDRGPTFFMTSLALSEAIPAGVMAQRVSEQKGTLLGYSTDPQSSDLVLNPSPQDMLPAGHIFLHYIATARLEPSQLQ